jgi:hypothetical protein
MLNQLLDRTIYNDLKTGRRPMGKMVDSCTQQQQLHHYLQQQTQKHRTPLTSTSYDMKRYRHIQRIVQQDDLEFTVNSTATGQCFQPCIATKTTQRVTTVNINSTMSASLNPWL